MDTNGINSNGNGRPTNGTHLRQLVPVDQVLVKRLQQRVGARRGKALEEFRRRGQAVPKGEDARQHTESLLASVLNEYESELVEDGRTPLEEEARVRLEAALKAHLFGAGNLDQLLDDPEVEDITINNYQTGFVKYADGSKVQLPQVASSDKELEEIVKTISAHDGLSTRPFDILNYSVTLRMTPDRVFVGEVLGDEVITMLNAMMQGNDGSLSTIHANSARDVISKIQTYALQAEERLPFDATNGLIDGALDFIVFMRRIRTPEGRQRRIVESVLELAGRDQDGVKTTPLWVYDRELGRTVFTRKAIVCEDELLEAGWDPDGPTTTQLPPPPPGAASPERWQI